MVFSCFYATAGPNLLIEEEQRRTTLPTVEILGDAQFRR